ncbi:hypothetical protein HBI26_202640 [Parastagonospora nodorum]|nr:hypothetical protein HBI10_141170 [Parastagonospora nodorum]KAH4020971.1 hypothetical protein HBI13_109470 [Parastagonospora nodorum]KAH4899040.1 hypothetical protein HBH74_187410 [Parastagonospora nodorum]KAH4947407.1 hypothetical protein HBH73_135380 [Parastagonospora nodorum]KAH5090326.1 hypothetical protein HBH72_218520 [Parastagonospora nodorum]
MATPFRRAAKNTSIELSQPRISDTNATYARVLVGPKQTCFIVREDLLVHYSKFFRAALTGNFSEARDKTVKLAEDDPKTFEFFAHWLYLQRFPDKSLGDPDRLCELWMNGGDENNTDNYVTLHVFGDQYDVGKLRSDTIDKLVDVLVSRPESSLPSAAAVELAFTYLPRASPMCQVLIDAHCFYGNPSLNEDLQDFNCIAFLHGLWRAYADMSKRAEIDSSVLVRELDSCDYHEHATEGERPACRMARKRVEWERKLRASGRNKTFRAPDEDSNDG